MLESPKPEGKGARAQHLLHVMEALRQHGPLSQSEIMLRTGVSRATVSSLVNELRAEDLIVNVNSAPAAVGRPPEQLALNPAIGTVLGIDFGQSSVQVALADLGLTVLSNGDFRVPPVPVNATDAEQADVLQGTLERTSQLVQHVLAEAGRDKSSVIGVGMALRAPVDRVEDLVYATTFIRGWQGFHPAHDIGSRLDLPVVIDNDANACALAETFGGAARDCTHILYVKASTGVGGGVIIDRALYRGAIGTAGEIGHNVADETGDYCYCGNRGCLHTIVGAEAVAGQLRKYHGERLTAVESSWQESMVGAEVEGLFDRLLAAIIGWAQDGDPACRRVLEDVGRHLGVALASACNLLNPQCLVIGGTLRKAGDIVLKPLAEEVGRYATVLSGKQVPVTAADLPQGRAEIMGALTLALREPDVRFAKRLGALLQGDSSRAGAAGAGLRPAVKAASRP